MYEAEESEDVIRRLLRRACNNLEINLYGRLGMVEVEEGELSCRYVRSTRTGYEVLSLDEDNPLGRMSFKDTAGLISSTTSAAQAHKWLSEGDLFQLPSMRSNSEIRVQALLIRSAFLNPDILKQALNLEEFDELEFICDQLSDVGLGVDLVILAKKGNVYIPVLVNTFTRRNRAKKAECLGEALQKVAGNAIIAEAFKAFLGISSKIAPEKILFDSLDNYILVAISDSDETESYEGDRKERHYPVNTVTAVGGLETWGFKNRRGDTVNAKRMQE